MKFELVRVSEGEGAILAHGIKGPSFNFKKGRRLSAADVAVLADAGTETVAVARLEAGDIGEDAAADIIARAIAGPGLTASAAFTGRSNLYASGPGLCVVDADRIDRLNRVNEAITVATLAPFAVVAARHTVATIKIIPFAAPEQALRACRAIAGEGPPPIRLAPFQARRIGLIQTMLPGTKPSVLAATVATTRARVESLGATLVADVLCAHQTSAVARALSQMSDQGLDPILILGASAIVDRRDVVPAAVTTCGGEVLHLGMPVDPGNLLMLASLGGASVVGLPGCARSPKLNGFDWVLQRLVAGLAVTSRDIMGMGVGGLLTEIGSRPMPRRTAALDPADAVLREPAIAAVILAAGRSTRMGGTNKMLSLVGGRPLIVGAVEAALASRARPVVVVVGHQADAVRQVLTGMPVSIVDNHDFVAGVSTSIAAGLAAVPAGSDGAVFMLADMPRVKALHIDRLIAAFHPGEGRSICIASHRGKRGNPVLWARRYFPEMAALEGDVGARALFARHGEEICEVEMADDGVLVDIDSPEALTALDPGDPVSAVSGEPASV